MKKLFSLLTLALLTMSAVAGNYVKVTSAADLTSGKYLIVYEDGNVAFNGALTSLDVASNTVAVTIDNGVIAPKDAIIAAQFDIDVTAGTIKSASGYYIGQTSDANGMKTSTTEAYTNTITITDGNADIKSNGGAYLRYNASSGQERFRYFKSSTYTNQKAIQLYKWDGEEDPVLGLVAPVFHPNGGEITQSTEVTLTCATENASIFYWEGTEEEQSEWIHYSAPFYVNETKTFTAVSTKGNDMSDYVTVTFTKVMPTCAKPTFTPGNGTSFVQGEELDVTINCATEGASILYTVNDEINQGTAPVVVTLTESATITAVASAEGYNDSDEATATYTMVVPTTTGPIFNLVTDVTTLAAGDHIILVNGTEDGAAIAMGALRGNNFGGENVVVNGNKVQTDKANIITLEKNGDNWNLKASEGYLYAASSSANQMKAEQTVDENGNANAAISIADNEASIVFQGTNTRNNLRYNPNGGTPIFSCYEEGKQSPVYIYKTNEVIVAAPTFNPAACEFEESIDVTINCATEGATLHYVVGNGDEQTATAPVTVTLTETTTITAYAELNGVESDIVEATYTLKEATGDITTLAQVNALNDGTDFEFKGDAVVTYQYGQYLFLRDATGYGLIYGSINTNDSTNLNPTFEAGQVLSDGWTATYEVYNGVPEFTNPEDVEAAGDETRDAAPFERTTITTDNVNEYVILKGLSLLTDENNAKRFYNAADSLVLFNTFSIELPTVEEGKTYDVTGLVTIYQGAAQIYITEMTEAAAGLRGDVNDDKVVNISDVTALIDYLLNPATEVNLANADCNLDSAINISDVTSLIDYLLSGSWPAAE